MQKRTLSLISFILLIIFVVLSFMPVIIKVTSWEYFGAGIYASSASRLESFAECAYIGSFTGILVYICLLLAFGGIVALILQFVGKQSRVVDLLTFSPVATAALFMLHSLLFMLPDEMPNSYSPTGYFSASPGWGFYIALALIIAVAVMSAAIATGKVNSIPVPIIQKNTKTDEISEIRKYKQLLDDGVITQDEFDTKKKQLLNL